MKILKFKNKQKFKYNKKVIIKDLILLLSVGIQEKAKKTSNINKIINIEIEDRSDYIAIIITDHGVGFTNKSEKDLIKPYFTTKQNGSGLGLSIVNKIINDHNGSIKLKNHSKGAKVELTLPK